MLPAPKIIKFRRQETDLQPKMTFFSKFLTFFSNLLNNQNLSDCHTCYKVFSAEIIKKIDLKDNMKIRANPIHLKNVLSFSEFLKLIL